MALTAPPHIGPPILDRNATEAMLASGSTGRVGDEQHELQEPQPEEPPAAS